MLGAGVVGGDGVIVDVGEGRTMLARRMLVAQNGVWGLGWTLDSGKACEERAGVWRPNK